TVRRFWTATQSGSVSGAGYTLQGEFSHSGVPIDPDSRTDLRTLLQIAALCNDAVIELHEGRSRLIGDPTAGALVALAAKGGCRRDELERRCPRLFEIPFDAERKRMSTVHRFGCADDEGTEDGGRRTEDGGAPSPSSVLRPPSSVLHSSPPPVYRVLV